MDVLDSTPVRIGAMAPTTFGATTPIPPEPSPFRSYIQDKENRYGPSPG
jgi:hypothetical protein